MTQNEEKKRGKPVILMDSDFDLMELKGIALRAIEEFLEAT
jgi:hypothetical protein